MIITNIASGSLGKFAEFAMGDFQLTTGKEDEDCYAYEEAADDWCDISTLVEEHSGISFKNRP